MLAYQIQKVSGKAGVCVCVWSQSFAPFQLKEAVSPWQPQRARARRHVCTVCVCVCVESNLSVNVYPWLCVYLPISADMHALTQTHTHTLFTAGFIFSTCLLYNQGDTGENIDSLPLLPPHSWFGYLCVLYADETEVFLVAYFWCSNGAQESLCACRSELLNIDEKMLHKYNQYARTPHRHTTLRHSHTWVRGRESVCKFILVSN